MKRYSTLVSLAVFVVLMGLMWMSPAAAVVPKPDGFTTVNLAQGWYADQLVWYIGTTTDDIRFAQTGGLTLAPKLHSALAHAGRDIFIVQNFQQGPVFSQAPGTHNYSGIWKVTYIKWKSTVTPRPITNSRNQSISNPFGLPPLADADRIPTMVTLDFPILIIGPLGIAEPSYVIPQMISWDRFSKTAVLPFFNAFCQDFITKKVTIQRTLITESSNKNIAPLIGANFAETLGNLSDSDTMSAWLMNPIGTMNPPSQLPVLEFCPTSLSWRNANQGYSPVVEGHLLFRATATPSSIFNNPKTIDVLLDSGALIETGDTSLNVQVIEPAIK